MGFFAKAIASGAIQVQEDEKPTPAPEPEVITPIVDEGPIDDSKPVPLDERVRISFPYQIILKTTEMDRIYDVFNPINSTYTLPAIYNLSVLGSTFERVMINFYQSWLEWVKSILHAYNRAYIDINVVYNALITYSKAQMRILLEYDPMLDKYKDAMASQELVAAIEFNPPLLGEWLPKEAFAEMHLENVIVVNN